MGRVLPGLVVLVVSTDSVVGRVLSGLVVFVVSSHSQAAFVLGKLTVRFGIGDVGRGC